MLLDGLRAPERQTAELHAEVAPGEEESQEVSASANASSALHDPHPDQPDREHHGDDRQYPVNRVRDFPTRDIDRQPGDEQQPGHRSDERPRRPIPPASRTAVDARVGIEECGNEADEQQELHHDEYAHDSDEHVRGGHGDHCNRILVVEMPGVEPGSNVYARCPYDHVPFNARILTGKGTNKRSEGRC